MLDVRLTIFSTNLLHPFHSRPDQFFSHSLPLVGAADDAHINVLGYMFVDQADAAATDAILNSPSAVPSASTATEMRRQTEHYDLHVIDQAAGLWGGSYVIYQDTLDAAMQPVHSIHISFNVQAVLVSESASAYQQQGVSTSTLVSAAGTGTSTPLSTAAERPEP
jgi:hypothetical protein